MSVLHTLTISPSAERPVTTQQGDTRPAPGAGDVFDANLELQQDRSGYNRAMAFSEAYNGLFNALDEEAQKRIWQKWHRQGVRKADGTLQDKSPEYWQSLIWPEVVAARQLNPSAFKNLPGSQREYDDSLLGNLTANRVRNKDVADRSQGFLSGAAGFGGAMIGAQSDPINAVSNFAGGPATGLMRQMLFGGLANMTAEAATIPGANRELAKLGDSETVGEQLMNVGAAGAFGAGFPLVIKVGGKTIDLAKDGAGKLYDKAVPLEYRLAKALGKESPAQLTDREIAQIYAENVPAQYRTPAEADALRLLERDAQLKASNPGRGTYADIDAHLAKVDEALAKVSGGIVTGRPAMPGGISGTAAGDFDRMLVAEGGIDRNGNFLISSKGAVGPAQVMPQTAPEAARLAGLPWDEARYRSDPMYNRALGEAYHKQMLKSFGGDRRKAAAAYNAGPGNVNDAIAQAKREGGSWEQYLPGETKDYLRKVFGKGGAGKAVPIGNAKAVTEQLFPGVKVTSSYRGPDHPLSKKNPDSYHATTHAAVDVPPIKGMTFEQFVDRYRQAGYTIIEAINETGAGKSAHATGDHWHIVLGEPGGGSPYDALTVEAEAPYVRPAALDAVRPVVTASGVRAELQQFRPADIDVDAALMQFKGGGDQFGVTERLRGIEEWDPISAGAVTVWEANDGRRLIADGHQRLGLAKRMQEAGKGGDIRLNAFVLREADGISAADARIITALKNIAEGSGSLTDAAKIFREGGPMAEDALRGRLPPRSTLVRDGKALARLSDEAFGAVVNEVVPESWGAAIGALAPDPATHMALIDLLAKFGPPNRRQAESIIRQAIDAGFSRETQEELFGSRDVATALFGQKAKILDRTLGELRKLKDVFRVAGNNAGALEGAGSRIDVAGAKSAADLNAVALDIVDRLALRKGTVGDLFNEAAKRLSQGEPIGRIVADLVEQLRELDLDAVIREDGAARGSGDAAGGSGLGGLFDDEAQPAFGNQFGADGLGDAGLGLGDPYAPRDAGGLTAEERATLDYEEPGLALFDDPVGDGAKLDVEAITHNIEARAVADVVPAEIADPMAGVAFAAREGGDETAGQVLKGIEAEEAALKALRDCL